MGMMDKDVVDRFEVIMGFGKRYQEAERYGPGKIFYRWQTTTFEHAQATIAMLWPWLGERRKQRAAEILAAPRTPHYRTRTHCKHGHLYDEENTKHWVGSPGTRYCRQCAAHRSRVSYAKKKREMKEV